MVSRSQKYQEHVDEHQVELALALSQMNVPIAWSPGDLVRFINDPKYVSISDFSNASANAISQSLQHRFYSFDETPEELLVGIPKSYEF